MKIHEFGRHNGKRRSVLSWPTGHIIALPPIGSHRSLCSNVLIPTILEMNYPSIFLRILGFASGYESIATKGAYHVLAYPGNIYIFIYLFIYFVGSAKTSPLVLSNFAHSHIVNFILSWIKLHHVWKAISLPIQSENTHIFDDSMYRYITYWFLFNLTTCLLIVAQTYRVWQ